MREKVESIAYRLTFGVAEPPLLEADLAPLFAAQMGRIEGGVFAFRFPVLQTHLAAAHLVRRRPDLAVADAVAAEATRKVLVAALQWGNKDFRNSILASVEALTRAEIDLTGSPLGEIDLDSTALPPLGTFSWPPIVMHALSVVRDAVHLGVPFDIGQTLQSMIDFLVWQGVFGGGGYDRKASLSLLALASPERVLAVHRLVVSLKYDSKTTSLVARHLHWNPEDPQRMNFGDRWGVLVTALSTWSNVVAVSQPGAAPRDGLLNAMLRDVVTISRVSAVGLAVMAIALAINTSHAFFVAVACATTLFLPFYLWVSRDFGERALAGPGVQLAPIFARICGSVSVFFSLVFLVASLVHLFTLDMPSLLTSLILLWVFSWPISMLVQVVCAPTGHRNWLVPQWHVAEKLPRRDWDKLAYYYSDLLEKRFGHLRSPWRIALILILGGILAVLPVDLPVPARWSRPSTTRCSLSWPWLPSTCTSALERTTTTPLRSWAGRSSAAQ